MQPQLAISGIRHISLLALNAEATVNFYVDVVGLHISDHALDDESSAPGQVWLADDRSRLITIIQSTDGQAGELGIGTIHHVALSVASADALLKWKQWLQNNQILVLGAYDQQAYQDIIFTDPDGVLLEIATRGPGWEVTQDGRDVYSPPKESMAPYRNEELISIQTWDHPVTHIEPDMVLQGLHHVSTIASSFDETDRFYRDTLGLPLVRKTLDHDDPEVEHWYWGRDGGRPGTVITAFPIDHAHEGRKPIYGRVGVGVVDHVAFDVDMEDEALRHWSADLLSRGLAVTSLSAHQPQSVSLRGPDGHVVELVAAGEDSFHDSVRGGESVNERTHGTGEEENS